MVMWGRGRARVGADVGRAAQQTGLCHYTVGTPAQTVDC